jgi:hypothetical protein
MAPAGFVALLTVEILPTDLPVDVSIEFSRGSQPMNPFILSNVAIHRAPAWNCPAKHP